MWFTMPGFCIKRRVFLPLTALFCLFMISGVAQTPTVILGRPTNSSVTTTVLFDQKVSFQVEYGTTSGMYTAITGLSAAEAGVPFQQEIQGLNANQRYFYHLKYKKTGATNPSYSPEYTFHTQRSAGSPFTFVIEADEHLYDKKGVRSLYEVTIANQAADKPDFLFSLGDMFGDDHTPETTTSQDMKELHMDYVQYLGKICHSAPFLFCLGNHEGENGYYLNQNDGKNIAVYGTLWRKYFFPNPYPNEFYSGNQNQEGFGMGYPENYYAFTWGDAQLIVLDVYRHCDINEKPKGWDWTLGDDQYRWFKKTLEESTSKYKFVLAHHTRGQGRGGINTAKAYEWGGNNGDNSTQYQFDTKRPGWGLPIHQLMVKHGVDVYFQGHDHVYAHEVLDGVVYQTLPMPSDTTYRLGIEANGDAFSGVVLDGCGHLRVTVGTDCASIEYVQSWLPKDTLSGQRKNRQVAHQFAIGSCTSGTSDKNEDLASELLIIPNPASDRISVHSKFLGLADGEAVMLNSQGKILSVHPFTRDVTELTIPTDYLLPGVYFVRLTSQNRCLTAKCIISHP